MGLRQHWCYPCYYKSSISASRIGELFTNEKYCLDKINDRVKLTTLQLVSVSMLIFVPQIRSSKYLSVLAEALPSLLSAPSQARQLSIPELPSLRKLVLVQNEGSCDMEDNFVKTAEDAAIHRHTIDFREILTWSPSSSEKDSYEKIRNSLQKDDIINLQFTRSISDS